MIDVVTTRTYPHSVSMTFTGAETAFHWWRVDFARHVGTSLLVSTVTKFTGNNPVVWRIRIGGSAYDALDGDVVCTATASSGFSSDEQTYTNPATSKWVTLSLESSVGMFAGIEFTTVTVRDS